MKERRRERRKEKERKRRRGKCGYIFANSKKKTSYEGEKERGERRKVFYILELEGGGNKLCFFSFYF